MTVESPQLVRVPAAAAMIGVSRNTVWRLVRSGELPAVRIRTGCYILRATLDDYLAERLADADRVAAARRKGVAR